MCEISQTNEKFGEVFRIWCEKHIERGEYSLHHELLMLCKWEILLNMKRITGAVSIVEKFWYLIIML